MLLCGSRRIPLSDDRDVSSPRPPERGGLFLLVGEHDRPENRVADGNRTPDGSEEERCIILKIRKRSPQNMVAFRRQRACFSRSPVELLRGLSPGGN
jgi:hypothetical protein